MNNARVITPDNSSTTSLSVSRDHPDFSLHLIVKKEERIHRTIRPKLGWNVYRG